MGSDGPAVTELAPAARSRSETKSPTVATKSSAVKTAVRGWETRLDTKAKPMAGSADDGASGTWGTLVVPKRP